MLTSLAVGNYRSLLDLRMSLGPLNVITGPNGSGKSNLYKALRLLAQTGRDGVVAALAREGGLQSTVWAGPEDISRRMESGEVPVEGSSRSKVVRLRLGFASDDLGYAVTLGLPPSMKSAFSLDPEIKREAIWAGEFYRPASSLVERKESLIKTRCDREWKIITSDLAPYDGMLSQIADPRATPEVFAVRERIRGWRFYDHFRTDKDGPARQPQLGTRTPVLSRDGHDLAAAPQTIREVGDFGALDVNLYHAAGESERGIFRSRRPPC